MSVPVTHLHSPIELLLSRPALLVQPETPISEVAALMLSEGVSAVLVDSEPIGILTERDLLSGLAVSESDEPSAGVFGSVVAVTVDADTDIIEAAALMLQRGLRHLVVRVSDEAFAIASLPEITAALVQAATPERWMRGLMLSVDVRGRAVPSA